MIAICTRPRRVVRALVVLPLLALLGPSGARVAQASPTSHSFDGTAGFMSVDYPAYLSKHDIVFHGPVTDPKAALPVGTGRVGGMVWDTAAGIAMQISGVDASQQGFASQGLVTLKTTPAINSGYTTYQQRLALWDGVLTNKYDANRTITFIGAPDSEVVGIHVEDSRSGVTAVALDLGIWDVSAFSGGDVPSLTPWRTVTTFVDPTVVGFSRAQADTQKFGYTMAATVEGATFTTQAVDARTVRLNITPTTSYTIWISCASRINAPANDSVTQAKALVNAAKAAGYTATLTNFKNWWHAFWAKSFVQYANGAGDADYLENFYYLSTYFIAAGAYGNYPFHFINGAFSAVADNDSGKWGYGYWYWNQRDVYHSFLASNHPDVVNGFNRLYSRNYDALKAYTMTRYGIDGIWVPETMGWNASAAGTINSDYTQDTLSTAAEAALNMYHQYKYTNDTAYLSGTAYPFMREATKFYAAKLSFDVPTGKYFMASSNAHEQHWDIQNAITDLAAVRALFPATIGVAATLGLDASARVQWQTILDNLVAYPIDPGNPNKYFPHSPPLSQNRNNENVVLELAWPYNVTGIGAADQQILINNYNDRPYPYGSNNVWDPAPIQAARLGLGNEALLGMRTMLQRYQSYPNGRTTNSNGEFEYLGVHLIAMNESLLQSYNDKIRVFPAIPTTDTTFNTKFTLAASDGFLVTSEREASEVKYVGIKSLHGKTATVINPWGSEAVQVRRVIDNVVELSAAQPELTFATTAGTIYVIERVAKPLSAYTAQALTATANNGVKSITVGSTTLSLGTATAYVGPKATFYPDINYAGTGVALAPGSYTISQMTAAGIANDQTSSIRVPAGLSVVAYGDGAFDGPSWTIPADRPNLGTIGADNTISSFVISTVPGGGSVLGQVIQAETYSGQLGVQLENTTDTGGGQNVSHIDNNDYVYYTGLNLGTGAGSLALRVAGAGPGGTVQVRLGNTTGTLLGTCTVPPTGGWQTWTTVTCPLTNTSGVQTVYLLAKGTGTGIMNLNWIRFDAGTPPPNPLPLTVQAEAFSGQSGIQAQTTTDTGGGQNIAFIENNDYAFYNNLNLGTAGATSFSARVASGSAGGSIQVRLSSTTGTLLGTCTVAGTGGWQTWTTVNCPITNTTGTRNLYLVFKGGAGGLMNVNWFRLQ